MRGWGEGCKREQGVERGAEVDEVRTEDVVV